MSGAIFPDGRLVRTLRCHLLLAALVCGATLSMSCNKRDMDAIGETETPFVFMFSPSHAAGTEDLETMAAALGETSGLTVDIRVAETEDQAVSSAGTPYFDAFLLPLFDYLFCHQEYDVEAGLQVLRHGNVRTYRGEILARVASDVFDVENLQGRKFAFVDAYSTSGFLYPAKLLRDAGVSVESTFAGSHEAALEQLRAGEVDGAAAFSGATRNDPHLRVIARTDEIPNEPVFFRAGLDPAKRDAIINALIVFAGTDEGRRILGEIADITGFIAVNDEYYRDVHTAIEAAEQSIQDLVPRGWRIHAENQRTLDQYAP